MNTDNREYEIVHEGSENYRCSYEQALVDAQWLSDEYGEEVSEHWDGIYVGKQLAAVPVDLDATNLSGSPVQVGQSASGADWGGKREGAGSGGKREGAGRPRTTWKTRGQNRWVVEIARRENGMTPDKPQLWTLMSIDENGTLEFQDEDENIISIIHPNQYE